MLGFYISSYIKVKYYLPFVYQLLCFLRFQKETVVQGDELYISVVNMANLAAEMIRDFLIYNPLAKDKQFWSSLLTNI